MIIRFIGDVHANFDKYLQICNDSPYKTIQVGDFGLGFADPPPADPNHLFIRGNHDNPALCENHPCWIKDGTFAEEEKCLYIGGAESRDKAWRIQGVNWWPDEQLGYYRLQEILFEILRNDICPEIMVTHDCPQQIASIAFGVDDPSLTREALQSILHLAKPKFWIFGHHHKSFDREIEGCRFICLNELEYIDIDLGMIK